MRDTTQLEIETGNPRNKLRNLYEIVKSKSLSKRQRILNQQNFELEKPVKVFVIF